MNKDIVYLVWTNTRNGKKFKIGELYKEKEKYYFKYIIDTVKKAINEGFSLLVAFPQLDVIYENPQLFAAFSSRLPDKRRPEIKEILATYGMTEYDEFELLKRSGAKLPTDHYEFVI